VEPVPVQFVFDVRIGIQNTEVCIGAEQGLMFVLTVNIDESVADRFQRSHLDGGIVDEAPACSFAGDLTPENQHRLPIRARFFDQQA